MATETSVGVINQTGVTSVPVDVVAITPAFGSTYYRQTITIADANNPVGFAPVDPVLGITVYSAQLQDINAVLRQVLAELQAQTSLLGGVSPTA